MRRPRPGFTLVELVVGMAIMAILTVAFAGFLRSVNRAAVSAQASAEGQEDVRQGLDKLESAMLCANEITVASATLVEFICDIDETPGYDRKALTVNGLPRYLDADRDGDAYAVVPSSAQWQVGFDLKDDDEDGDGKVDLRKRVFLSSGAIWLDLSVDEQPWGGAHLVELMPHVSTFTLAYFGSKANLLGRSIDLDGDGVITAAEMDAALAPRGQGNADGALDTPGELSYVTQIHILLGWSPSGGGASAYESESDVYPPLLPLKPDAL